MAGTPDTPSAKVSPSLATRLASLPDTEGVRVVVLLDVPPPAAGRRLTPEERSQAVAGARAATARLLDELRPILDAVGARQVDRGGISPLGGVVVDLPARGVAQLAEAEQVRAILSDQPLARPNAR